MNALTTLTLALSLSSALTTLTLALSLSSAFGSILERGRMTNKYSFKLKTPDTLASCLENLSKHSETLDTVGKQCQAAVSP